MADVDKANGPMKTWGIPNANAAIPHLECAAINGSITEELSCSYPSSANMYERTTDYLCDSVTIDRFNNLQYPVFGPTDAVLRNGVQMPVLGLGTSHSGGYSHSAVVYALKQCNYRLIDTAKRYGCEEYLQKAIKESEVPREELFITTRIWPMDYGSYSTVRKAFDASRKRLGVDYIDLYMIHWPLCPSSVKNKEEVLEETWRSLELLYDEGLCQAIGVSNYEISHLENMLNTCSVIPHVNQMEFHPYHNPIELRQYCLDYKIQFQGYSPLGKGQILNNPLVQQMAEKYSRSPAQILIRWSVQNGVVTIPKSTKEERVLENSQVFDFALSSQDMAILNSLHCGKRYVDTTKIQQRIDSQLPDGYKLRLPLTTHVDEKASYRNHS